MSVENTRFPATGMPDRDWWEALWPDPDGVLAGLGIGAGQAVVDLCCGDGLFLPALLRVGAGPVWALDCDPAMLDRARAEVADEPRGDEVRWIEGDAVALADHMGRERADVVFIANTFHGAPDPAALIRAVHDSLTPNGRFIVVGWHARPREETVVLGAPRGPKTDLRQSPDALADVVCPVGFRLERVASLPPYHYGAIFSRT